MAVPIGIKLTSEVKKPLNEITFQGFQVQSKLISICKQTVICAYYLLYISHLNTVYCQSFSQRQTASKNMLPVKDYMAY